MARRQIRPARALTTDLTKELVDRLTMSRNTDKPRIDRISNDPDDRRPGEGSTPAAGPGKRHSLVWLIVFLFLTAGAGLAHWKQAVPWPAAAHMGRRAMAICTAAVPEAAAAGSAGLFIGARTRSHRPVPDPRTGGRTAAPDAERTLSCPGWRPTARGGCVFPAARIPVVSAGPGQAPGPRTAGRDNAPFIGRRPIRRRCSKN